MATLLPAMEGQFGSTKFWIVTMPAKELTERLTIPTELDGWEEMSIEERYQRDIDYNRVKKQIAPYLTTDDDRFFGAFIVSMVNGENVEFEPLGNMVSRIPNLYKTAGNSFGFLTLEGDEVLVPLDGQHRLAALEFAISGKDQRKEPISGMAANLEVGKDVCTVILIKHDRDKSRKIFNKVNRYAKATSKGENLLTADDDAIAVIVRENISDEIIPARLINYKSNTLPSSSPSFTTLATLYEATKDYLQDLNGAKIDTQNLPPPAQKQVWQDAAVEFWKIFCDSVDLVNQALHDPSEAGDDKRRELRNDFLLGRPFTQMCLVNALLRLRAPLETGARLSWSIAYDRVNSLDWSTKNLLWQGVIMGGDRILSGRTAVVFASQVISYWLGEQLLADQVQALNKRYSDMTSGAALRAPFF